MASEREFLEKRHAIILQRISQGSLYKVGAPVDIMMEYEPIQIRDYPLELERRLIEKLLNDVEEGKIHLALASWYKQLNDQWSKHCEYYKDMRIAYEKWASLPWPSCLETSEPPRPPDLQVEDTSGNTWFVEHQLLGVILDLHTRLSKWLDES